MATLRLVLGDQLSLSLSSFQGGNRRDDLIVMCEVQNEATYVKHHKKKIAFLFSAMRHFAQELREEGWRVHYTCLDDPKNTGSFSGEVQRVLGLQPFDSVVFTAPGEHRVLSELESLRAKLKVPVEIRSDDRFLTGREEFESWARGRKQLRMEFFYREMRKKHRVLMDGDEPEGGQWNFDAENRKAAPEDLKIPEPHRVAPDAVTNEVLALVAERFSDHFGSLSDFHYGVTRRHALEALSVFVSERLACFGDYQDAMLQGQPWMLHAHLSLYLNCGLLLPGECVQAAEAAYRAGKVPLHCAEGFIRQILGWREFVRGIYWLEMPSYKERNELGATRKLPAFYWTAETRMNCLRQCVLETRENAYAHHIQRLMVLGNFALLAGIRPEEVQEWFLSVYADAFEWVELPNVTGMALFADGGVLASKPYAAGGSYISKMSNYCESCAYKVTEKNGPQACPFNYLYWDFLARNAKTLQGNPRLGMIYRTFEKMSAEKKAAIASDSQRFLASLGG